MTGQSTLQKASVDSNETKSPQRNERKTQRDKNEHRTKSLHIGNEREWRLWDKERESERERERERERESVDVIHYLVVLLHIKSKSIQNPIVFVTCAEYNLCTLYCEMLAYDPFPTMQSLKIKNKILTQEE